MTDVIKKIAEQLRISQVHVEAAIALLKEGNPVPFIARYRKDRTGGLTDPKIRAINERFLHLSEMEQRRAAAIKAVNEANKMTPELQAKLESTSNRAELEDLYMPFRSRRRIRSTAAKAKGLEPLADLILNQHPPLAEEPAATLAVAATTDSAEGIPPAAPGAEAPGAEAPGAEAPGAEAAVAETPKAEVASAAPVNVEELVTPYINAEKGVKDMAEALAGARDIIAERIAEDAPTRKIARDLLLADGKFTTKARDGIDLTKGKYAAFVNLSEPVGKIASHKIINAMRGSTEKQVSVVIEAPREKTVVALKEKWLTNPEAILKPELILAIEETYDRLLAPALDNELRQELKRRVDLETAAVCARNLRAILMQAPLGNKPLAAIEPTQSAGLKLAILSAAGKLVAHEILNPEKGDEQRKAASESLLKHLTEHSIQAVAIGNGPGSREADLFVRDILKSAEIKEAFSIVVHVHGTPQTTREDLADMDAAVRGAFTIGRRLQDPLAELVRVDPTTLNLGQHQHDVDEATLKQKLDEVFESCVSEVGVDANHAPAATLRYVAGIGAAQAAPFVEARKAKGGFKSREDMKELAGCASKTFEHTAAFLRIKDSTNPLDVTAIHPEEYATVEAMAASVSSTVNDLLGNAELIAKIELPKFKTEQMGDAALKDILEELKAPGRDLRGEFVKPEFNAELREVKDLKEGMILSGVVTNLTAFGAFVDIGVHQDGLVHISAITHSFIRDASEAVTVGQHVKVKVLSVDAERKRISLSMKELEAAPAKREPRRASAGSGPRSSGPRPPRAAGAPSAPGAAPREGQASTPGAAGSQSRPPRRDFRPRTPRPDSATPAATVAASAGTAPVLGADGLPAVPLMPRRLRERPQREGSSGPRRDDRDRQPRAVKPPEPGKPDYSKFFVKGKGPKRDDKDKKRDSRGGDGASRDEVREIMRKQNGGGTSLADLLKKAGVATDENGN